MDKRIKGILNGGRPRKPFCSKGHRMAGDNIVDRPNGSRECRQCKYDRRVEIGSRPGFKTKRNLMLKAERLVAGSVPYVISKMDQLKMELMAQQERLKVEGVGEGEMER